MQKPVPRHLVLVCRGNMGGIVDEPWVWGLLRLGSLLTGRRVGDVTADVARSTRALPDSPDLKGCLREIIPQMRRIQRRRGVICRLVLLEVRMTTVENPCCYGSEKGWSLFFDAASALRGVFQVINSAQKYSYSYVTCHIFMSSCSSVQLICICNGRVFSRES